MGVEDQETTVNIDEPISAEELWWAEQRVLKIQTKLHQWASNDPDRVFADLFNLVVDPAFLMIAWDRVRGNQGARSAGVDGGRRGSSATASVGREGLPHWAARAGEVR
jgi:RNA-directed DNA polymerase